MTKKTATPRGVVPQGDVGPKVLTPKQARFVDEYMIDLNAAQAAIRAGYSKRTAKEMGYQNLTQPHVAAAIEAKRKELAATRGITRERVLDEMAKIAFSDLRDLYKEDGSLKHPHEWPEGAAGAVSSMEFETVRSGRPDEEGVVESTHVAKVKIWDKGKQLENLLKHLGMAEDKPATDPNAPNPAMQSIEVLAAKVAKYLPQASAD